jgi:hypothetical protein
MISIKALPGLSHRVVSCLREVNVVLLHYRYDESDHCFLDVDSQISERHHRHLAHLRDQHQH